MPAVRFDFTAFRPRGPTPADIESLAALLHQCCRCDCASTLFAGDFTPLQSSDTDHALLLSRFHTIPPPLQDHWRHVAAALFGSVLLTLGASAHPIPDPPT